MHYTTNNIDMNNETSTNETPKFMDPSAQEFVNIMEKGTYEQLLQLYYKYKGFYITGTADFVQGVVVQFMEEYCIELKQNNKNTARITQLQQQKHQSQVHLKNQEKPKKIVHNTQQNHEILQKKNHHSQFHNKQDFSDTQSFQETNTELYFGDDWYTDFEDPASEQPNSHHPSIRCEPIYACNTGSTNIPTVFQSHMYFRNSKYYLNLLSDPFASCGTVESLLYRFLWLLYTHTLNSQSPNPWNFKLYMVHFYPFAMIGLNFEYNTSTKTHKIKREMYNDVFLKFILDEMHQNNQYMTVFTADYSCTAGWLSDTVGGAHCVACGIIKKDDTVFIFIIDPNSVQEPMWWLKYKQHLDTGARFKYVEHVFNIQILSVLSKKIKEKNPNYRILQDTKININPFNINFSGSPYQEGGYCVLISFFFIHILYNNIVLHNKDVFKTIDDMQVIIQYIKELMIFIYKLINSPPFTMQHFFYNYSINIFRFFLSTKKIEEAYEINDFYEMIEHVNDRLKNKQMKFTQVTSANVIVIYINEIFRGLKYLPSLIGVPKIILEQSNCKYMLRERPPNYSCIKFYTPFRNEQLYKDQPLRLWFADDKERVTFGTKNNQYNIYIHTETERGKKNLSGVISRPDIILLNLQEVSLWVLTELSSLIKDYSIMSPKTINSSDIMINSCKNIVNPHTHTNRNSNSNCVIS